jgi:hypothetical protein
VAKLALSSPDFDGKLTGLGGRAISRTRRRVQNSGIRIKHSSPKQIISPMLREFISMNSDDHKPPKRNKPPTIFEESIPPIQTGSEIDTKRRKPENTGPHLSRIKKAAK